MPSLNIAIGGSSDPLGALSRIAWEGGPAYWTVAQSGAKMAKADAAGWSDPSFFPIGTWLSPAENVTQLQAVGINVMVGADPSHDPPSTATAQGMFVLPQYDTWTPLQIGNDPLCVAWHVDDEPELSMSLATYQSHVADARSRNDGRFVHTNFAQVMLNTFWWSGLAASAFGEPDLSSVDHYYYTAGGVRYNTAGQPADGWPLAASSALAQVSAAYGWAIDRQRHWGGTGKPHWLYVETQMPFLGADLAPINIILYAQMRGAIWSSLIHEARGILYFEQNGFYDQVGAPTIDPNTGVAPNTSLFSLISGDLALRNYVATLNAQIKALAPVLNTQSYVWNFGAAGVDTMLKSRGGFAYIFAGIGLGGTTGSKTFTLPPGVAGTSVTVVDEARSVSVSGGAFTDSFANEYTVHVYKVSLT